MAVRSILHLDLDSFFVAVECLKNSKLRGLPLAIGGGSDRGVVASCSYEARRFGIRAGMSNKVARLLLPELRFIRGDMETYSQYSHLVTEVIAGAVPLFEKASIDEFYIDLSGMEHFYGCFSYGSLLKQNIKKETGLNTSFGLAINKTVSKVATGESKPSGSLLVGPGHEGGFMAPLPIRKIPMAGPKTSALLMRMGVRTAHTLSQMPEPLILKLLGKVGPVLQNKARGIDTQPVVPYTERKSISAEQTFEADTTDTQMLERILTKTTEKLAYKLRSEGKMTSVITVKIKYSNHDTHSRQLKIPYTTLDNILIEKARELFKTLYNRRLLVRLIGVRLSGLVPGNHQIRLFEDTTRQIELYQTLDSIKQRYGKNSITRAAGWK